MRPLEWLAKTGRLTTLRDVLYFIFDVNSHTPTFFTVLGTKTAIAAPPTRDVLDRRAAHPGDCTAWESADRESEMSKALDPSDIQRPSPDECSHARPT